ncbi:MAG: hypothetical protein ABIY70_29105 [Capsulimonas sp.]|uniref:hypothetical protein n=1 Tax=Capsulimonas sp. TaxID=2494211 RepID=UPI00326422F2
MGVEIVYAFGHEEMWVQSYGQVTWNGLKDALPLMLEYVSDRIAEIPSRREGPAELIWDRDGGCPVVFDLNKRIWTMARFHFGDLIDEGYIGLCEVRFINARELIRLLVWCDFLREHDPGFTAHEWALDTMRNRLYEIEYVARHAAGRK